MKHSSQHQTPVNHAMATNRIAQKQKYLNGSNQLSASSASNTNTFNAKVFQAGNSSAYNNKENKPNLHISSLNSASSGNALDAKRSTNPKNQSTSVPRQQPSLSYGTAQIEKPGAKSLREKTDSLRHKNQPHSIREPNKSASSAGVGMFSKDYNSTQVHSNDGKSFPGERQACQQTRNNNGQMSKSIENVVRKANYKGIEPLRRRFGGPGNQTISTTSQGNSQIQKP